VPSLAYADAAADALRWVAGQGVDRPGGAIWTENGAPANSLYTGTAGVLLALAEATRFGVVCDEPAGRARDRLVHLVGDPHAAADDSLFDGTTGWLLARTMSSTAMQGP
jgi:hypothetical protein